MPESLNEKIAEIALEGRGIAFKYLKNKQDSEDVVQEVFIKVFKDLQKDDELIDKFKNDNLYMRNYINKSITNKSINYLKHRKVKHKHIKDVDIFEDFEGKDSNSSIEHKDDKEVLNPLEQFIKKRKDKFMKKYIKDFKVTLKDDEKEFLDALYDVVEIEEKSLIARAAEKRGIPNDQGHNVIRRIERKLNDYLNQHPEVKDYKAKRCLPDLPKIDFKLPFKSNDEDRKAGERMADRILKELDNDAIDLLSEIL